MWRKILKNTVAWSKNNKKELRSSNLANGSSIAGFTPGVKKLPLKGRGLGHVPFLKILNSYNIFFNGWNYTLSIWHVHGLQHVPPQGLKISAERDMVLVMWLFLKFQTPFNISEMD